MIFKETREDISKIVGENREIIAVEHAEQQRIRNELGRDSLKSLALINGGAAIAILAFTGSIWSDKFDNTVLDIICLKSAIFSFTFGVTFAVLGSIFGFLANSFNLALSRDQITSAIISGYILKEKAHDDQELRKLDAYIKRRETEEKLDKRGMITLFILAILFVFCSLASLIVGVRYSLMAFFP